MQAVRNGMFAGMWQIHGMASALGWQIKVHYPTHGGFHIRPYYDRVIMPRECRNGEFQIFKALIKNTFTQKNNVT